MAKCGLKNMNSCAERCLSLRVDMENLRHRTIVTSDVWQKITTINHKAREEWEKKQAETEKSQKLNETESYSGIDGDKDKVESSTRSAKANKDEADKMRTTAANVAVRAATGVGDILSRWQLMIEAKQKLGGTETLSGSQAAKDVARKPLRTSTRNTGESQEAEKRDRSPALNTPAANVAVRAATGVGDMLLRWQLMIEAQQKLGGAETLSGSQAGKDLARKPLPTSTRNTRENQAAEKRDRSPSLNTPASVRKVVRNQVVVPRVCQSISVKDVIAVSARELKSTLIYRLCDKIGTGDPIWEIIICYTFLV